MPIRWRVCLPVFFGWCMVSGSIACPYKIGPHKIKDQGVCGRHHMPVLCQSGRVMRDDEESG